jgi:hypothetical protein
LASTCAPAVSTGTLSRLRDVPVTVSPDEADGKITTGPAEWAPCGCVSRRRHRGLFPNGAVFSSWYARLAAIQDRLGLGPGLIGLALLGAPLGLLLAQLAIGGVIARRGSQPLLLLAPLISLTVVLPALAVDFTTLLLAVVIVGVANGVLDIAMNAHGVAVERATQTRLFTSSALQRLALVDAAASWLSEPNGGDQLAHALLGAACTTEVTAEHAYLALITPSDGPEGHSEGLPS